MRILQLASIWETVPPPAYGGTEAVVGVLCEELVRRGVDITLCAAGDSTTAAELRAVYPRSLRTADDLADRAPYDWMHIALSLREAQTKGYDLIHNHAGELAMAMSHLVDLPMLTTMHCLITPDTRFVWDRYQGSYNTVSHTQRATMPAVRGATFAGVVHNAIDVEAFPFSGDRGDYLLFLSRVAAEKGTHLAVDVARRLGMRLVIAGKVDRADRDYFTDAVGPLIDGKQIIFAGEADAAVKRELYRSAYCLLMPICWEEPFGLVMVEAMACGTPVIAFHRGAAPEIVVEGRTGYLVEDVPGMVEAVRKVDRIDPQRCRDHVTEHFSPPVMAERYLAIYRSILDRVARQGTLAPSPKALPVAKPVEVSAEREELAVS